MRARLAALAFGALALGVADAQAQTSSATIGMEYRSVSFGDSAGVKTMREAVIPIGLSWAVSPRISIDAGTSYVSAQRTDPTGSQTTLNGVTDLLLRSAIQLKPDVAVFTVAVNLPTGHKSLSSTQLPLASATATDLIPYPVTNFGTALSVTTGLAFAMPVGPWAIGLAGSFRYTGSYNPLSDPGPDTLVLKPGAEIRVRVGADRIVGQGRVSFGLTYSTFSNDEFGNQSRSLGARVIPQASWAVPLGNNSLALYVWDVYRNIGDTSQAVRYVNTITGGAALVVHSGRNSFRPQIEFRQSNGLTPGRLIGLIARYQIAAGDQLSITPGVRFDAGTLTASATATPSFTGLSASLTLRTSF
jgi:hypothetical protein